MANFALTLKLVHEVLRPVIKVRGIRVNTYEPTLVKTGWIFEIVRCTIDGQDFLVDGSFSVLGPQLHVHLSACFYTLKSDISNSCLKTHRSKNKCLCLIEAVARKKLDTWALSREVNFMRSVAYIAGTVRGVYSDLKLLGGEENRNRNFLSSQQDIGELLSS